MFNTYVDSVVHLTSNGACLLGQTDVGRVHNTEETTIVNGHHTRKKQRKKKNSKDLLFSGTYAGTPPRDESHITVHRYSTFGREHNTEEERREK